MPLEIFTNPDARPNIKDLSLETPEAESKLRFDPKRDITEEDWEGISTVVKLTTNTNRGQLNVALVGAMDVARARALITPFNSAHRRSFLEDYRRNKKWDMFMQYAERSVILGETVPITEKEWQDILGSLKQMFINKKLIEAREMSAAIVTIDRNKLPNFSPEEWTAMSVNHTDTRFAFYLSRFVKIKPDYVLNLNEEYWKDLLLKLSALRNVEDWDGFIDLAYSLTIFSEAEKKNKPEFEEEPRPLPEVRKF